MPKQLMANKFQLEVKLFFLKKNHSKYKDNKKEITIVFNLVLNTFN